MISNQLVENLINDLLDLAKLESNHFVLNEDYFDFSSVIQKAFQVILHQAND